MAMLPAARVQSVRKNAVQRVENVWLACQALDLCLSAMIFAFFALLTAQFNMVDRDWDTCMEA